MTKTKHRVSSTPVPVPPVGVTPETSGPETQAEAAAPIKTHAERQIEEFEARRLELQKDKNTPEVIAVIVPLDSTGTSFTACYIGTPGRAIVSTALAMISNQQPLQATEVILRECWIEGDKDILEKDELFYAAHMTLSGIISFRVGILKKN